MADADHKQSSSVPFAQRAVTNRRTFTMDAGSNGSSPHFASNRICKERKMEGKW